MNSVDKLIEKLNNADLSKDLEGVDASISLEITGTNETKLGIEVINGQVKLTQGGLPSAVLSVTVDEMIMEKLLQKQLNPINAYMSGDLRVKGDMSLALRYMPLIKAIF